MDQGWQQDFHSKWNDFMYIIDEGVLIWYYRLLDSYTWLLSFAGKFKKLFGKKLQFIITMKFLLYFNQTLELKNGF